MSTVHAAAVRVVVRVRTGVPVAVVPEYTLTVTVVESALGLGPAAVPAVPVNVNPLSFEAWLAVGAVIVTVGAVVSTTKVTAALVPVLPARSVWLACAVNWPLASAAALIVHAAPERVALSVCVSVPPVVAPA